MPLQAQAKAALEAIPAPPLQPLIAAADALRNALIRVFARAAGRLIVDRERRVAMYGALLISIAFLATCLVPLWMIALGPLVWGVPHILSDIRYLIARQGLHRRPLAWIAIMGGSLGAVLGFGIRAGLCGAAMAILFAKSSILKKGLALLVVGSLIGLVSWAGPISDVWFAHLHNLVAVGLWWAWRPRKAKYHWIVLGIFALCSGALFLGACEPVLAYVGGYSANWTGITIGYMVNLLSPFSQMNWAVRMVLFYAFAQSVHYIVWVRLIPEDDRRRPTPRSYRQSFKALQKDVGSLLMWATLIGILVFAIWAVVKNVATARNEYLNVAFFHGYLELAAAALLWAEGRPLWKRPEDAILQAGSLKDG